jgi:DnaJ-class molecular chaperone
MNLIEQITEARKILGLPEQCSLDEIEQRQRALLMEWHPDKCRKDPELCQEKTRKILEAGKVLLGYCRRYPFDFSKDGIKVDLEGEELWNHQFGKNDPFFGG